MNRQDIVFDHNRSTRIGLPEAVFCEGKSDEALLALLDEHSRDMKKSILFTLLAPEAFAAAPPEVWAKYDYHLLSHTAFTASLPEKNAGSVVVVSAGTAESSTPLSVVLCEKSGITLLTDEALPLSSTMVREAAQRVLSLDGMVPQSVARYISDHRLYPPVLSPMRNP